MIQRNALDGIGSAKVKCWLLYHRAQGNDVITIIQTILLPFERWKIQESIGATPAEANCGTLPWRADVQNFKGRATPPNMHYVSLWSVHLMLIQINYIKWGVDKTLKLVFTIKA